MQTWLLPEYVEDILPPEARRLEDARRQLLDLFHVHGYRLVIPPLLEYLPSLLSGSGQELDIQTLKVVDQLSGRMMGIRADTTPQAARIDAHLLNRNGVVRLCYAGSVLHAQPEGMLQTREPLQIGAELFGYAGIEGDLEIQQLMLKAFQCLGIGHAHLDLGHVGIFQALIRGANISSDLQTDLIRALQSKDRVALECLTAPLDAQTAQALRALPDLYGGAEVLVRARECLPQDPAILKALTDLETLGNASVGRAQDVAYDLSELRGYNYHSGVVFAVYVPGLAQAVAKGGRYDEVGLTFGRARSATGFSLDMRALCRLFSAKSESPAILAPWGDDPALQVLIEKLRGQGEVVIVDLPDHETDPGELGCDRRLMYRDNEWQVTEI